MKRFIPSALLLALAGCLIPLSGCRRAVSLDPPALHLGQDTCHACGMIVGDERFAAAVVLVQDGRRRQFIFDDLGEMLRFTPPRSAEIRYWAHDFVSKQWIDATTAHYIRSKEIETPMGTGAIAYAGQSSPQEAAKAHKTSVQSFDEMRQKGGEQPPAHH